MQMKSEASYFPQELNKSAFLWVVGSAWVARILIYATFSISVTMSNLLKLLFENKFGNTFVLWSVFLLGML